MGWGGVGWGRVARLRPLGETMSYLPLLLSTVMAAK